MKPFKNVAGKATGVRAEKGILSVQCKLVSNLVLTWIGYTCVQKKKGEQHTVDPVNRFGKDDGVDEDEMRTIAFITVSPNECSFLLIVVCNVGVVISTWLIHRCIRILF